MSGKGPIKSIRGPSGTSVYSVMALVIEKPANLGEKPLLNVLKSALGKLTGDPAIVVVLRPHNSGLVAGLRTRARNLTGGQIRITYVGPNDPKHQGALQALERFMDEAATHGYK